MPAARSTWHVLVGSNRAATVHARIFREKLSMVGMDIRSRPVEQSDDGGIDMPSFVGLRGTNADGRLRWMTAVSRTPPAMLADELGPGGDRGEDLADPLGVEREGTQRHVAMLGCKDHGLHSGNFGEGELARAGAGTRRAIVGGAGCRGVAPGMVTSRFEAENPEDQSKGEPRSGALDGPQDVRLGSALRQSSPAKVELGHSKQGQQKPNDGGENSSSTVEFGDGLEKVLSVLIDDLDGDDWAEAAPLPGRDRGTGDGEAVAQRPGTRTHHVLAQAMVIATACARLLPRCGHHRRRITDPRLAGRKPQCS